MQQPVRTFSYTARRGPYLAVAGTLGFLLLAEGSIIALIILIFAHTHLLKLILLSALAAFYLFFISGLLLAPLWTRHRLSTTHLHLHYGLALNVAIPRSALASAQAVHERLTAFQPLSARYEAKRRRIVASFSEQGQVLLCLAHPMSIKVGRARGQVEKILINVNTRDEFLKALALPGYSSASSSITATSVRQDERISESMHSSWISSTERAKQKATSTTAIRAEGLTRRFDNCTVVDNLNMSIRAGEIYGFLGSNGAGKTTAIKMLVGLLQPDAGHAWIAGYDVWNEASAAKAALGYVADRAMLYERLTGREFLAFLGQMRGLPQAETEMRSAHLLDLLELTEHAERLCGAYSFGMKRKLALAGALLHQPQVLILDEPLNGLDPRSARRIKDLFNALAATGTTILLSTHDLATAEEICHRIGIIHRGRLLAEGSSAELRRIANVPDLEAIFLNLTSEDAPLAQEPTL
jgi:ABC-2 type transport system ATP-binding protein